MIEIDMKLPSCCDECFALDFSTDYPYCVISKKYEGYNFDTLTKRMPSCPMKDNEPMVLTLEEVEQTMTVWGEINGHGFETMPLLLDRIEGSKVRFVSRDVNWYLEADKKDYAKSWRCWSAKPTDEQREAVPWDE